VRAVLDVNVLFSAVLAKRGTPARVLDAWRSGSFELIVSPALMAELERALGYSKIRKFVSAAEAEELVAWLVRSAVSVADPVEPPPMRSSDPGDDYLLALAAAERAVLVSGDRHLLELRAGPEIQSPSDFLSRLER
jgi:uncharacterized protein